MVEYWHCGTVHKFPTSVRSCRTQLLPCAPGITFSQVGKQESSARKKQILMHSVQQPECNRSINLDTGVRQPYRRIASSSAGPSHFPHSGHPKPASCCLQIAVIAANESIGSSGVGIDLAQHLPLRTHLFARQLAVASKSKGHPLQTSLSERRRSPHSHLAMARCPSYSFSQVTCVFQSTNAPCGLSRQAQT